MRVGVPSGVGDTYWTLTKLQAFRKRHKPKELILCIKQSPLERATGWAEMVDFVDGVVVKQFDHRSALLTGFSSQKTRACDCILWPNAVLDRGMRIESWLPGYKTDLSFPVRTAPGIAGAVVLYVSSVRNHQHCFPRMPMDYWPHVARILGERFGQAPVIIGAHFDEDYAAGLDWQSPVVNLVGKTTLPEVAGIIQRAQVVVGIISGMTILGNHFRTPTVALCPDRYHKAFPKTWIARGTPYATAWHKTLPSPLALVEKAESLL